MTSRQQTQNVTTALHEVVYQSLKKYLPLLTRLGITQFKPWVEWRRERDSLLKEVK
jgi:hypothetical protein